jgi:signal transduction histidine kinase
VDGRQYGISVWGSLEPVEESEDALVATLSLGVPPLVVFVAIGSWLLAGRSLSPVESMRREVETLGRANLDRRLPEPGSRDEVGRLARTMNAMLERLERASDEQERFVADAAHELRSPLASLRVQLETAPPGDQQRDLLAEVIRLQRLADDLLLLARSGPASPPRTLLDFDEIVRAEIASLAGGPITFEAAGVQPAQLRGDAGQLQRLVRNLLENARHHAHHRVVVSVTEEYSRVVLAVADDGPGVPVAERERIFERFVRLDAARGRDAGGTGLGLAIVKSIAERHGGRVRVEDCDVGALFTVHLPAASS